MEPKFRQPSVPGLMVVERASTRWDRAAHGEVTKMVDLDPLLIVELVQRMMGIQLIVVAGMIVLEIVGFIADDPPIQFRLHAGDREAERSQSRAA